MCGVRCVWDLPQDVAEAVDQVLMSPDNNVTTATRNFDRPPFLPEPRLRKRAHPSNLLVATVPRLRPIPHVDD